MARGKVQMKRIQNPVHRQVTFCKRRAGLLKKANELSVLCDAQIGVLIFSANGKLYELATKGSMQELIERYSKATGSGSGSLKPEEQSKDTQALNAKEEVNILKQEIETLQKGIRYLLGGAAEMTFDELVVLEKNLEMWIYQIRSTKEGVLKAANQYLQYKMEESVEVANFAPMIANTPYPLTIQNEIFQF
ncbi:agamous-like MADS-box protein AGL12 isoform X3 [Euphorbia lathyris]|uniref:agamous-like MADS-box protein AGL12 isoform X3 n=1 Tax=Euphorbia lathyris TaxID=212925 RepID=UPI00331420B4